MRLRPAIAVGLLAIATSPGARAEQHLSLVGPQLARDSAAGPVERHSEQVQRDLLHFDGPVRPTGLDAPGDALRARDRLLLFREPESPGLGTGLGAALFGSAVFLAAHAPGPVRVLLDRAVHLGPACFDAGGLGIGVGGRWL